jgi:hypothetical protein
VLELIHGHSRQSSGAVVGGLVVVNLMDRNGSVDNIRLDSLLLNNRLNGLMDVVVDVLTTNGGSLALAVGVSIYNTLILELSLLLNKVALGSVVVAVVKLAVLDSAELSSVLFRENLTILDRLNGAVVVVLVYLLVDRGLHLLMGVRLNDLMLDSRSNSLVDSCVVVPRLGHEISDCCLGLIHCDVVCWCLMYWK